jgi:hypothetical protein
MEFDFGECFSQNWLSFLLIILYLK